jgi:hypothetical protein
MVLELHAWISLNQKALGTWEKVFMTVFKFFGQFYFQNGVSKFQENFDTR